MAVSRERAYYKAVRRAAAAVNSDAALKQVLDTVVQATARPIQAGVSLVLLDSGGKKLIHSSSWGLPQAYLQKGVLDADKSLAEVVTMQPVTITDAGHDNRIQYPDLGSVLGGPGQATARRARSGNSSNTKRRLADV